MRETAVMQVAPSEMNTGLKPVIFLSGSDLMTSYVILMSEAVHSGKLKSTFS